MVSILSCCRVQQTQALRLLHFGRRTPTTRSRLPYSASWHATMASDDSRYKLVFFTPPVDLPKVKAAIFETGAGTIGEYTHCCFTTSGMGQFKPGAAANPHIGQTGGGLEEVAEEKCEILCSGREQTCSAVEALKSAHPYEEPAYEVYKLEDF
ncbi:hypothetical protein RB596_004446 [Gaeumannomyces avenae]